MSRNCEKGKRGKICHELSKDRRGALTRCGKRKRKKNKRKNKKKISEINEENVNLE